MLRALAFCFSYIFPYCVVNAPVKQSVNIFSASQHTEHKRCRRGWPLSASAVVIFWAGELRMATARENSHWECGEASHFKTALRAPTSPSWEKPFVENPLPLLPLWLYSLVLMSGPDEKPQYFFVHWLKYICSPKRSELLLYAFPLSQCGSAAIIFMRF